METKKITEIVKTCGLSVIPEVDLIGDSCNHYHRTECIIENNELPYLNISNLSQKNINLKIDNELHNLNFELEEIKDIKNKNIVTYDNYKLHTSLLTKLFSSGTTIIDGKTNVIAKYIEIKSTNELVQPISVNSNLILEAFNKNGELIYQTPVCELSKIKRLEIYKTIDIPNQWDDVVKIDLKPLIGLQLTSELNIEIKLYYNIE